MWPDLWYVVLWIAVVLYFGVALVVAIGGVRDIRRMFRRISGGHDAHDADGPTG